MSIILTEFRQFVLALLEIVIWVLALFSVGWVFGIGFTLGQEVVYKSQSKEDETDA